MQHTLMKVYHGSYTTVEMPKVLKSKFPKDFGKGFYCTELEEQAVRWANRYDTAVVSVYEYTPDWDIGKVYKRLIIDINKKENKPVIDILSEVYNSWLSRKIEDFNSSVYYESPEYLFQSYLKGENL